MSAPVHTFTSGPQERAVRPGTLCLPLTVPTSALAAVLTSGTVFSVSRDPAAQVSGLEYLAWGIWPGVSSLGYLA